MSRWLWALLPVGLVGYALSYAHASPVLLFTLTAIGLVPLAALMYFYTSYHKANAPQP